MAADLKSLVELGLDGKRVHRYQKADNEFNRFLRARFNARPNEATQLQLMHYMSHVLMPRYTTMASVQQKLSDIDLSRQMLGLSPLQGHPVKRQLVAKFIKNLPQRTPYSPGQVGLAFNMVPFIPVGDELHQITARALLLMRLTIGNRTGNALHIERDSIKEQSGGVFDSVNFLTTSSKGVRTNLKDTNYLEHLTVGPDSRVHHADKLNCPACQLMRLKNAVDVLAIDHNFLFVRQDDPQRQLTSNTLGNHAKRLLLAFYTTQEQPTTKAQLRPHHLRSVAQTTLSHRGVSPVHLAKRDVQGGGMARTQRNISRVYISCEVPVNFSNLAILPGT